jgi:hypothetical protein
VGIGEIWSIARGLTVPWSGDKDNDDGELKEYKLKTAVAALEEIGDLVEVFARREFGTSDVSKLHVELVGDDLFRPYPE